MTDDSMPPVQPRPRWRIRPAELPFAYLAGTAFSIALYGLLPTLGDTIVGITAFAVLVFGLPMWLLLRFVRHGARAFAASTATAAESTVPMADSRPARRFYRRFGGPLVLAAGLALVFGLVHNPVGLSDQWVTWAAFALMLATPIGFVYWLGDRHR